MQRIKLYEISKEYIRYLGQYQQHVFYDGGTRKYIGILLEIEGFKYFAPLSSFKQKHANMKESVDFIKIKDYAVINLNNMIPVPDGQYVLVDVNGTNWQSAPMILSCWNKNVSSIKHR